MNNKYDSNNFNEGVENIVTTDTIEGFKNICHEMDLTKLDMYNFHPYDELMTSEDIEMHEIPATKEAEHQSQVQTYIDKALSLSATFDSKELDVFTDMMNVKINRYCFVTTLSKLPSFSLPNENSYKSMAKLIMAFLRSCNKNDDSDFLKSIITISSKLYYDIEENDDAVIRTHITEGIRKNKIWDNCALWGKAIFKDFRDIIRKFKIPKHQEQEFDKAEVLRNVLFNRLMFYVDHLAYFDMPGHQLLTLVNRFSQSYKFTESQNSLLLKKVVIDDEIDGYFGEEVKRQRNSGSLTKQMGSWMNKLEKIGTTAVTRMKTYIKKKEIDEEPVPDLHDEYTIDEDENGVFESTDTSKNNSECSPPKDKLADFKKEVEVEQILEAQLEDSQPEIQPVVEKEVELKQPELEKLDSELTTAS